MADAVELATAYVALVPSAKGIAGKLAEEMGGPAEKAGLDAGDKAGGGILSSFKNKVGGGALSGIIAGVGVAGLGAAALSIGTSFDDAFDTIRTVTGKSGVELNGLQESMKNVFKSVPTSAGEAGDAIAGLNQKLGLSGKPLEDLAGQVLELSRITGTDLNGNIEAVTGVFNNWGISAEDQGTKLDELFRASQATGVSVTDLSNTMGQSGSVLRQAGLSFEDSAALLGTLQKNGVDAASVMPSLSKAVATAAKEGKNATDVLKGTFDAIRNAPDDTSAAAAAMTTFGAKAGPQLAGLVRQGKLSFEELSASIAAGGDTVMTASAETQDFPEKFKVAMNTAQVALQPLVTKILDLVTALATNLAPVIQFIADHFKIIGPIIGAVAGAILAYKIATTVAGAATKAWTVIQGAFNLVMDANPITLVVLGIAALVAGVILAYKHFDGFRNLVDTVAGAIKAFVTGAIDFVIEHWRLLVAILTGPIGAAVILIIGHFDTIKNAITGVVTWVGTKIGEFIAFFVALPGNIISAIGDLASLLLGKGIDLIQGLINGYLSLVGTVTSFFTGLAGQVIGWIGDAASWLFSKGVDVVQGFINGYLNIIGQVTGFFTGLGGQIIGLLAGAVGWLVGIGEDVIRGLKNGIVGFFEREVRGFINIGQWIKDSVGDLSHLLVSVGEDIVRGLRDGISGAWHWVTDKVSELTKLIPGPVRSILGIGSPSKVFMALGQNVSEGMQIGIEDGFTKVFSSLNSAATQMTKTKFAVNPSVGSILPDVASQTATATAGLSGATFNNTFNQVGSDPSAISREISWLALTQR
jgi:TP901 family phage tail tape measure protein